jgi:DNA-directed RNA polymerase beta' subunit
MLLSRLGIFSKVSVSTIKKNNIGTQNMADVNRISIRCQWATKLSQVIELVDDNKQNKLELFNINKKHCNFKEQNDVVLDEIINIKIINVADYPEYAKVYDLTVPSTLNFGLANGLHVVDTAESGYIQRKLVKTMEDLVIKYDSTLRAVNNKIIQFVYGDSGADARYQYEYTMKMVEQNNQDIMNIHKFTQQELKEYKFSDKDNEKLYNTIITMRDNLRHSLVKSKLDYITLSTGFLLPININRILNSVKNDDDLKKQKDKLEPQYVIDKIDELMTNEHLKLMCLSKDVPRDKSFKVRDEQINKTAIKCALYDLVSPKKAIIEHNLNKTQFDEFLNRVSENYNKNIIQPGEHAGVLSAQAMGEPVSQMSEVYDTLVHIYNSEQETIEKIKIGEFIDRLMKENADKVIELPEYKNSTVLDIPKDKYKIINVSSKEKTNWQNIEQISKHPANGKLISVKTRSGRINKSTLSHSYLKRTKNSIIDVKGSELKVGDRIPVTRKIQFEGIKKTLEGYELTNHLGWVCGAYLADGTASGNITRISKVNNQFSNNIIKYAKDNLLEHKVKTYEGEYGISMDTNIIDKKLTNFLIKHFSQGSFNKCISGDIFNTNKEFIAGIISGYFDGDGNVNPDRHIIRSSSRSLQLLEDIALLLNYFGIFATIHTEKEKGVNNKPFYTLHIQHKYAKTFKEEIGFVTEEKGKLLNEIIEYAERDNNYSLGENIDMIPELGETIAKVADYLEMPARSRLYRRYLKKKAIGRETLGKYIERFNDALVENKNKLSEKLSPYDMSDLIIKLSELKQAYNSDIVWDEITSIEYEDGEDQYVYDFTVPGNDSFMVNSGVLVHNTLKAFHKAGIAAISDTLHGVPRIKELLSLSKKIKTPQMIIYLSDEYYKNKEMAHKIASYIRFTTLGQIRNKVEVFYDPNPYAKGGFMEKDNVYNIYYTHNPAKTSCQVDINNLPWLIRIELDREKMLDKEVTLLEIKSKFCNQWEKRYSDIKNIKKEEKYILDKIIQCALLSNTDNDEKPVLHLRFDMTEFEFTTLNDFIDLMIDRFKLKGISGIYEKTGAIEERVLKFDNDTGSINKDNQFVIYTQGVNLYDIRYLIGVDVYKTICNDIVQIYETFGIEAARAIIVREISLAFKRHGADVNYNHLSVIVDLMTANGRLMSVDRHGMNKSDNEPLARVSFEKMVEQLITAAVFNEVDSMQSVSSRIMAGLVVKGGTGMCDVVLDTELLEKSEYIEEVGGDYDSTFKDLGTSNVIQDMIQKEEAGEIFMPM